MKVLNLDVFSGEKIRVDISGRSWYVPSDLSTEYALTLWNNQERTMDAITDVKEEDMDHELLQELINERYDLIYEIFSLCGENELPEKSTFRKLFNAKQVSIFTSAIINAFNIEGVMEEDTIKEEKKKADSGQKDSRKRGQAKKR